MMMMMMYLICTFECRQVIECDCCCDTDNINDDGDYVMSNSIYLSAVYDNV